MSETVETSLCDRLIDYAYGELGADESKAFEGHLAACKKCHTEVTALKRVRSVMRQVMPAAEPSAALTGGLHAQLLHAAAERASAGKVLPFRRRVAKVLFHPGFAVAATVALVGGAMSVQWQRGALMPAPEQAAAPSVIAAETPNVETAPAAAPVAAAEKEVGSPVIEGRLEEKGGSVVGIGQMAAKPRPRGDSLDPSLDSLGGTPTPKAKAPARDVQLFLNTKDGGPPMKVSPGASGAGSSASSSFKKKTSAEFGTDDRSGGAIADPFSDSTTRAKSARAQAEPADEARLAQPNTRNRREEQQVERDRVVAPVAPAAPAPMPAGNAQMRNAPPQTAPAVAAPVQNKNAADDELSAEALRGKAEKLAESGQCEEAVRLYKVLERRFPSYNMTPQQRLLYVRCLRPGNQAQNAENFETNSLSKNRASSPKRARSIQKNNSTSDAYR